MKNYNHKILFAVTRTKGISWDESREMRLQKGWTEHTEFMNKLSEDGFVVLGGPICNDGDILLIIDAKDEKEIRDRLSADNWSSMNILTIKYIRKWKILLQSQF